jgi:hypothetical protein
MLNSSLKTIRLEGFSEQLRQLGASADRIAAQPINAGAEYAHDIGRSAMLDEIAFPTGYIDSGGRFFVSKQATTKNLEARISARDRATSLARFVVGNHQPYKRGVVRVRVKRKGTATPMRGAWLTGVNSGNRGLAVRARGGRIPGRRKGVAGLPVLRSDKSGTSYLLYGPSVNQAFKGVGDDIKPKLNTFMAKDFSRRFQAATRRSLRGGK